MKKLFIVLFLNFFLNKEGWTSSDIGLDLPEKFVVLSSEKQILNDPPETITHLTFKGITLDSRYPTLMKFFKNLKCLVLDDIPSFKEDIITDMVEGLPIESLTIKTSFHFILVWNRELKKLLPKIPTLKEFSFSTLGTNQLSCQYIFDIVASYPSINKLSFNNSYLDSSGVHSLNNLLSLNTLTHLSLSENQLSSYFSDFMDGLKKNNSLISLSLEKNNLSKNEINQLVPVLFGHKTLKYLSLIHNNLRGFDIQSIVDNFKDLKLDY
jgi:hypothetical protein